MFSKVVHSADTLADRQVSDAAPTTVIHVESVSKQYQLYAQPQDRLKQAMFGRFGRHYGRPFWALRDFSLTIRRGETVGIIGKNGSGKSTLLQIIAGTLQATTGTVEVHGRLAALLELGSGFNPEYTGRENVYLNGALLGLSNATIDARFADIEAFADIGSFIDQPVKLYSSGMFARLAFSVSIHTDPDILIVDEILSVGDAFFQAKCVRKLDEYRANGGTVLFVSHDSFAIQRICSRVVLLNNGQKVFEGDSAEAINLYYKLSRTDGPTPLATTVESRTAVAPEDPALSKDDGVLLKRDQSTGDGAAVIEWLRLTDERGLHTTTFACGDEVTARVGIRFERDLDQVDFGLGLRDRTGVLIGGAHTFYSRQSFGPVRAGQTVTVSLKVRLDLAPGTYLVLLGVASHSSLEQWVDHHALWDCVAISLTGPVKFWGLAKLPATISVKFGDTSA